MMSVARSAYHEFTMLPVELRIVWGAMLTLAAGGILSTALAQLSAVVAIIVFLLMTVRGKVDQPGSATLLDLFIPVLVLARLVSIPLSVDVSSSLVALRTEIPFYALFFAFVWALRGSSQERLVLLVRVLTAGAILASVIGVAMYLSGESHRAESLSSGYYTLGMYLTCIFALVIGIGADSAVFRNRIVWYGILGLLLVGVLFTFNRVHWVICGVLLLIMGITRERKLLAALMLLAAIAVIVSEPLQQRVASLVTPSEMLTDRDVIWREALKLGGDRPLTGYGPRSFHAVFPEVEEPVDPQLGSWHNDMLQIYMESGLIALLAYIGLMVTPLWLALRRLGQKGWRNDPVLLGGTLLLASVFLGGLFGIFFTDPIISPLTYLWMAIVVTHVRRDRENGV